MRKTMHIRFQNLNDWYSYNSVFYSYKSMNNIIGFHLKSSFFYINSSSYQELPPPPPDPPPEDPPPEEPPEELSLEEPLDDFSKASIGADDIAR